MLTAKQVNKKCRDLKASLMDINDLLCQIDRLTSNTNDITQDVNLICIHQIEQDVKSIMIDMRFMLMEMANESDAPVYMN